MDSHTPQDNLERFRELGLQSGIDLVSSARLDDEHLEHLHDSIRELGGSLRNAVVIGIRLSEPVLKTVKTAPTWTYYHHYRTVNFALDQSALRLAAECQRMGYRALPLPASQILDWDLLAGHLSHRKMGEISGLGWRGRNNLLVHPEFGSHVRLATILTDAPLPERGITGDPGGCGPCRRCIEVCPVGAIAEDVADFDLDSCTAQLRRFSRSEKLNTLICGLCVRACRGFKGAPDKAGKDTGQ
jgi:epoxyqueuosine reductase QueG